ncbi:hypothetical protein X975_08123, partial [Stegodyphus mimosarum]
MIGKKDNICQFCNTKKFSREMLKNIGNLLHEWKNSIYSIIMKQINNRTGRIIYLDVLGGTGKTFLMNLLLAEMRAKQHVVLALASFSIAATLMEGGLQLPLNIGKEQFLVCKTSRASGQCELLKQAKIIFWMNVQWRIKKIT